MTEPLLAADATEATLDCDVAIVGAGPVGLALARALADSLLRVVLIDARARGAWAGDPRALALAYGKPLDHPDGKFAAQLFRQTVRVAPPVGFTRGISQ